MSQKNITRNSIIGALTLMISATSVTAWAQQKQVKRVVPVISSSSSAPASTSTSRQSSKSTPSKPAAEKVDSATAADGYVASSSTHIDFTETSIDGKMKAPDGFMLQGHQSNSLSQMVKLRSNFRNELNNSKTATKALVK